MRQSEKELYELEAEIRPNRYVALALALLSFFVIAILLFNEIGIFAVRNGQMRVACFAVLFILEIPQFVTCTEAGLRDPRTKYLLVVCTGLSVAVVCIMLNFHVTLALILPIFMAAQYPHPRMSRIALLCSILCAFFCPVVSYLIGAWDPSYISWLYKVVLKTTFEVISLEPQSIKDLITQIIIYLSIPHTLILLACYPLSASIAKSGKIRLKNQIQVLHMSESDALTGLLNRLRLDRLMAKKVNAEDGNAAVVYIDANDLHRLNNEKGHSEGDRMLICVADNLRDVFGNESVYRIGGDEFIAIIFGYSLAEVQKSMKLICAKIEENGYSISYGLEYAKPPCTLPALVEAAETKMMIDKAHYHISR